MKGNSIQLVDLDFENQEAIDDFEIVDSIESKVLGSIPPIAYLICFIEFSERFSYYMITGCLTNMIQHGLPKDSTFGNIIHNVSTSTETPGALNLGLSLASFTMQFLTFFANIAPIISGYYADSKIGKFRTIYIGIILGIIGHCLLTFSSIPFIMNKAYISFTIILISVCIIAISAGTIKSTILPLLLDQYEYKVDRVDFKQSSDGRTQKIDHSATMEMLSMSFYMWINWGCTLSLVGSFIERYFGFWLVYLLTAVLFLGLPFVLHYLKPRLIHVNHRPNTESNTHLEFYYHLKSHYLNTPIPINSSTLIKPQDITNFINLVILFIFFIPFYLSDSALISVQISLAATMSSSIHLPNDIYQALNPIAIICLIPFLSYIIYPTLLKRNMMPTPRTKIILGFTITTVGTFLGAYVQSQAYTHSNCTQDNVSICETQSNVSKLTWISYFAMFAMQAIGECFAATTCYELAYELSPNYLRSTVLALFLASIASSSVIGQIFSMWMQDPYLVQVFVYTGLIGLFGTLGFAVWSRGINGLE